MPFPSRRLARFIAVTLMAALVAFPTPPAAAQAPSLPSGTILVAGMNDNSVWLVDLSTGERRAALSARVAPHEIAVSSDGRTAAVTNYGNQQAGPGNLIQFVDVPSATVTREVVVDGYERLHGVAFLPGDTLLAVTSERTGEILVVSAADGAIRRKLSTGGRASHMLALGGPWIWVANILDGTVSRVDPSGATDTRAWPAGTRTEGVAATPDGGQGWTGSMQGGDVVGVDGATGEVVARVSGLQVPYRLAVTSDGATVVVTDPEAQQVVLIDRARGAVRARVDVAAAAAAAGLGAEPSPQGFTLSPDGRWAFVSAKAIDRVAVVELASARVVTFLPTGSGPDGIAFTPVRVGGQGGG